MDAAIARALHFSMSSDSASSSSSAPAPHHQSPLAYAPHLTTCDSVLVADSPPRAGGRRNHQQQLAPAGARAGKRRSRASKRAPTTYISTDPANFRIMVQQVTGVQAEVDDMLQQTAAVLLAADGNQLLQSGAYGNQLLPSGDEAALHQQLQQQPCFPTLDSWNVMYERSSDLI